MDRRGSAGRKLDMMDVHREERLPSHSPPPDPDGPWNPNPDQASGSAAVSRQAIEKKMDTVVKEEEDHLKDLQFLPLDQRKYVKGKEMEECDSEAHLNQVFTRTSFL